jgi:hypothetical protein
VALVSELQAARERDAEAARALRRELQLRDARLEALERQVAVVDAWARDVVLEDWGVL